MKTRSIVREKPRVKDEPADWESLIDDSENPIAIPDFSRVVAQASRPVRWC
jgi:hypothetical protein